jgi:hypothetical protein
LKFLSTFTTPFQAIHICSKTFYAFKDVQGFSKTEKSFFIDIKTKASQAKLALKNAVYLMSHFKNMTKEKCLRRSFIKKSCKYST